jgi:hypothetical protein
MSECKREDKDSQQSKRKTASLPQIGAVALSRRSKSVSQDVSRAKTNPTAVGFVFQPISV